MSKSTEHLQAHQGDIERYRHNVANSAARRLSPIWWATVEEYAPLRSDSTLVDMGTGSGLLLEQCRERDPAMSLVGVEMQPEMLTLARAAGERCKATIVEADLSAPIPLDDSSADIITAMMVFHELIYPPHLFVEAQRILRPGGTLFLYDWVKRPLRDYLRDMDRPLDENALQHFSEHCRFTAADLRFLAEDAGFIVKETITRRNENFALVVAQLPL